MFIYESKVLDTNEVEVEALNIVFGPTQIPVETPDVIIYKDAGEEGSVHVMVGDEDLAIKG